MNEIAADLCIIGAGSAGLSIAAGAAQLGARVVLIESRKMGGDCLNTGCVPSKALLSASKVATAMRRAQRFGIGAVAPAIDFKAVNAHVHGVIAGIAPHDSVERFEGLGCTVVQGHARFADARTVVVEGKMIRARRFVVATGSRAAVPPIPGLRDVPYLTNETIFENEVLPDHLIVIGAGPIGCEMAQAHRRLGARVTVLDSGRMLPRDDADAVDVVRRRLVEDGIDLREHVAIHRIERSEGGIVVHLKEPSAASGVIAASHVLVAAGRRPNIEDIGLDAAGVEVSPRGIVVDRHLRSRNRRVYAAGDVAGGYQFTHVAADHAGTIIRNVLFRLPAKTDISAVPWVTYCDPELAHVGLDAKSAETAHGSAIRVLRADFESNDRARAERETEGFIKAVVGPTGRILGATIVGAHAGELILPWVLAVREGLKIGAIAGVIAPYPTLSEISKRVAGSFYTPKLFSDRTRSLVRFLSRFG